MMLSTHATCDKIALCKRAYLCDMRLLHAVAGKFKSFNFLATACNSRRAILSHVVCCIFLSRRVNAPLRLGSGFYLGNIVLMRRSSMARLPINTP